MLFTNYCVPLFKVFIVLQFLVILIRTTETDLDERPSNTETFTIGNNCTDKESMDYIRRMCLDYSKGLVAGTFCDTLCSRATHFGRCLGHGVKPHVVLLRRGDKELIVKSKRSKDSLFVRVVLSQWKSEELFSSNDFLHLLNHSISEGMFGGKDYPHPSVLEELLGECDGDRNDIISHIEAVSCLRIVATEEYLYYIMLHGTVGIPKVLGTCGNMFAVEKITPLEIQSSTDHFNQNTWEKHAKIALSFLDIVEAFENTPHGKLYLCDVYSGNFGLEEHEDGTVRVKAIDLDISFFESKFPLLLREQSESKTCRKPTDCYYGTCRVTCTPSTGQCSHRLTSNNLQVICSKIFRDPKTRTGLLQLPPSEIKENLSAILDECIKPRKRDTMYDSSLVKSPLYVLEQLRNILLQSLYV